MKIRLNKFFPIETIIMALQNLRGNKFRSILTIVGIVIGVLTVIVIASLLTGLRNNIVSIVEEYGTNNIYAFHLSTGPRVGSRDRSEWKRKPLTAEDGDVIRAQASAVEEVANNAFVWGIDNTLSYNGLTYKQADLEGVSASYAKVCNLSLSEGRFITDFDDEHRRNVIVLGVSAAQALFPNSSKIVGNEIQLAGKTFEVIGVLEKRKSSFLGESEEDSIVLVPFRTVRKLSARSDFVMLLIRAKSGQMNQALDQVDEILRRQRGVKFNEPSNFDLGTADRFIQQFDSIFGAIGLVAIAISSVGLMVGGIGVMNIMLVSVTERTREIGVRKAIGARRRDIVSQFLFEAMTLTFLGGLIGVVLAIGISYLLKLLLPTLPSAIPAWAVIAGLSVSVFVGLVFGVWPARKASRLDPIEALRYE